LSFAVSEYGVSEEVIKNTIDPGIFRALYELKNLKSEPDAIEELSRKRQTAKRTAPNAKSRVGRAKPKTLAERMYGK